MRKATILIAEDDPHIRRGLEDTLESEGYQTLSAADGEDALKRFRAQPPDLVLLDIMMPGRSGYDVCREIRKADPRTPIIMLTAKGEEVDKVVGLQLGADDYITKPFGIHELLARIAAVLRRSRRADLDPEDPAALPDTLVLGTAVADRKTYTVHAGGREHPLTARELKLLETFYRHPDEVLSRERLLNEVWGVDYLGTTRTLDQHMAQLRKKIEKRPAQPKTLLTVHGVGYRYDRAGSPPPKSPLPR